MRAILSEHDKKIILYKYSCEELTKKRRNINTLKNFVTF